MPIRKVDIVDVDIVDAGELAADGYLSFLTTTLVSTNSGTKLVTVNLPSDGEGLITGMDHPVEAGDRVRLYGTTGGADGYYTISVVNTDTTFTVVESISSSTGGNVDFIWKAGASKVGFNPSGLSITSARNVQDAIKDIALEVESGTGGGGGGGGLTEAQHKTLRQLIHFIDEGPAEGFASGAYREMLPPAAVFPTQAIWWESSAKLKKIVMQEATLNANQTPATITWRIYDTDGVSVLCIVTDTITYSGVIELDRDRNIAVFSPTDNTITESTHRTLRHLIHFIKEGPAAGFASGAYREMLPSGDPFPTSIIWWESSAKLKKIVEKNISRNSNKTAATTEWKMYATDGISVISTVTDTHTYSGIFETSRTRSIA